MRRGPVYIAMLVVAIIVAPACIPPTEPGSTTTSSVAPAEAPTIAELVASDEVVLAPHAGGDLDRPHSTPFAFDGAVAAGAQVLEMDVMLSADGELVVHHDTTVDRITDGTGTVASMTLADLQALDAAHWFVPDCWSCRNLPADQYQLRGVRTGVVAPPAGATPEDFIIPTFRQIAQRYPSTALDVEIKGSGAAALAVVEALATELEQLDRVGSTIVVSFDDAVVAAMRERLPEVALSPGTAELAAWAFAGQPLGDYPVIQIPPVWNGVPVLDAALAKAHAEGIEVWVWADDPATQDTTAFYQHLIDLGVDGVIAGSPARWPGVG